VLNRSQSKDIGVCPCSGAADDAADVLIKTRRERINRILATFDALVSSSKAPDCGELLRNLEMKVAALLRPFLGQPC